MSKSRVKKRKGISHSDLAEEPKERKDMMQSPINIVDGDASIDPSLVSLKFNGEWSENTTGTFKNVGNTVQFNPTTPGSATVTNHRGTYLFQQFHLHWGPSTGTGSEHTFNGVQSEAEIHFVHMKKDETDDTQRDYLAVIGVLADVQEGVAISGPWAKMNVTAIQSNASIPLDVSGIVLEELLPKNWSYYSYQGSLTTPPYSETVQWFVMKEKISIPSAFLEQLKKVQGRDGGAIKSNFRVLQPLGNRVVSTHAC